MFRLPRPVREKLLANGRAQEARLRRDQPTRDFEPVCKAFTPDAGATWLLSELIPDDTDVAFGICDLGVGEPELGYVRISELKELRGPWGLPVELDEHFTPARTLKGYMEEAKTHRRVMA